MATRVGRGKIQLAAFGGPAENSPTDEKNLADISYTNRVIANFVPNFVAMATGVGQGKMRWWHLMADPRKPSYKRKKISQKPLTQADL